MYYLEKVDSGDPKVVGCLVLIVGTLIYVLGMRFCQLGWVSISITDEPRIRTSLVSRPSS